MKERGGAGAGESAVRELPQGRGGGTSPANTKGEGEQKQTERRKGNKTGLHLDEMNHVMFLEFLMSP